jgi:4'-phosphopantetheinyl transferase
MNVYWLQQVEANAPVDNDWLSTGEILRLSQMRVPKRQADWRLGRWTAKRAVTAYLNQRIDAAALATTELRPTPCGAPEVFVAGARAPVSISLTHRAGAAACVLGPPGAALGCDLEAIEPHSDAFVADYFTVEEQALVSQAPPADRTRLLALLWSAKESALKALRAGLRLDTRSLAVDGADALCARHTWLPLLVRYNRTRKFHGWWRYAGGLALTVVADPVPALPVRLSVPVGRLSVGDGVLLQPVSIPHDVDLPQRAASHTAGENA